MVAGTYGTDNRQNGKSMPSVTRSYSQALYQAAERLSLSLPEQAQFGQRVDLAYKDRCWQALVAQVSDHLIGLALRPEERGVGKEGRSRRSPQH